MANEVVLKLTRQEAVKLELFGQKVLGDEQPPDDASADVKLLYSIIAKARAARYHAGRRQ